MRLLTIGLFVSVLCIGLQAQTPSFTEGFFNFSWDEEQGKIFLQLDGHLDKEFLYVNSLSAGVGSNDLGLDRNQLGGDRVVQFVRKGPKILLLQKNLDYRAVSDNEKERQAVEEAFAKSVLWGFKREHKDGKTWIDLTPFLMQDAHGISNRLEQNKQGSYRVDEKRSAVHMPRTRTFPDNTEFDAMITLVGKPKGNHIRSVTPTAEAVTVHMHHSFVRLPDDNYTVRARDPRSGYYGIRFYDYASPIDEPLEKRYITRHRLEKKDPNAARSEAVEPIVYYIDAGCPEPIKSALMEGASWWNQAYEAAGFINAFQVRELPEGADPMDVRYNMINWVHRSTRGWSYGSSVIDPRTGEILKGHVLLGSLRVRQDYMIAQGLANIYENGNEDNDKLVSLALARLRQLAAHEVGHTIGLEHNFASSVNDRASVMDYPHPYVTLNNGEISFDDAYATGIGEWDKRAIIYGYSHFTPGTDEEQALDDIISATIDMGLLYMSDRDARPVGGAHPAGHLWDNGADPVAELERMSEVRAHAMARFGENTIPVGTAMGYLEQVLVPLYLGHRYQVEAVAKIIGGVDYSYAMRGDGQTISEPVSAERQLLATEALISTLDPSFLRIEKTLVQSIPPQPVGYGRHRELFDTYNGGHFDPFAAMESSVNHTLDFLMHPHRLARIYQQNSYDAGYQGLAEYLDLIYGAIGGFTETMEIDVAIKHMIEKKFVTKLLGLAGSTDIHPQVSASALLKATSIDAQMRLYFNAIDSADERAHNLYIIKMFEAFDADRSAFKLPADKSMPPGSPIGCGDLHPLH